MTTNQDLAVNRTLYQAADLTADTIRNSIHEYVRSAEFGAILRDQWQTPGVQPGPQEIVVGGNYFEEPGSGLGGSNVGAVNGGAQVHAASWAIYRFPLIEGYRREYRAEYQGYYDPTGAVSAANLVLSTSGQSYIADSGGAQAAAPVSFTTGQHDMHPNGYATDADTYYSGPWTDCEAELVAMEVAGLIDGWASALVQVGNFAGGTGWSIALRQFVVRGRYVETTQ